MKHEATPRLIAQQPESDRPRKLPGYPRYEDRTVRIKQKPERRSKSNDAWLN